VEVVSETGQKTTAEIVVKQSNGFDIGFKKQEGGVFELITDLDFWEQRVPADAFIDRLTQRYAMNKVVELADEQGFSVKEQIEDKVTGKVTIKLNRFATVPVGAR